MHISNDGKSIELTELEIVQLKIQGYEIIRDYANRVVEIKQAKPKKTKEENKNG